MASLLFSGLAMLPNPLSFIGLSYCPELESEFGKPLRREPRGSLASRSELGGVPAVRYAYDPLPSLPRPQATALCQNQTWMVPRCREATKNAVRLDPISAGLPLRSSLDHVHASRNWDANFQETIEFLTLLAEDDCSTDVEVKHGITLAKLAKAAIQPGCEDQMVLATHYMFPCADRARIRHIAAFTVMFFVFDGMSRLKCLQCSADLDADKAEETTNDQVRLPTVHTSIGLANLNSCVYFARTSLAA